MTFELELHKVKVNQHTKYRYVYVHHHTQLSYTTQYRTVLIIFLARKLLSSLSAQPQCCLRCTYVPQRSQSAVDTCDSAVCRRHLCADQQTWRDAGWTCHAPHPDHSNARWTLHHQHTIISSLLVDALFQFRKLQRRQMMFVVIPTDCCHAGLVANRVPTASKTPLDSGHIQLIYIPAMNNPGRPPLGCKIHHCNSVTHSHTKSPQHHNCLRPFFRDHPGEPVPEENFWTL